MSSSRYNQLIICLVPLAQCLPIGRPIRPRALARAESSECFDVAAPESRASKWPVLVVFRSRAAANESKANALEPHAQLARRARAIVISFNNRIGLLGECVCAPQVARPLA